MSIIVKNEGNSNIPPLEPGVYQGIATQIIDLGIQENSMFGKQQRKGMIIWNILGETIKVNDEELPRVISKEYTLSLAEKSTLRKDLEAWRGKIFSKEELEGFDLKNVLNVPCQLQLIQKEGNNGQIYTNIASIMSMPKGVKIEPAKDTFIFDTYDPNTWINYDKIANWIKEKIKKAINLQETQLDLYIKEYEELKKEQEGKQEENIKETTDETKKELPF